MNNEKKNNGDKLFGMKESKKTNVLNAVQSYGAKIDIAQNADRR